MAMRKRPWAMYMWPGLPYIWVHGSWSGLGVAVIAAALVCATMLGSFGWTELIAPAVRNSLWASLAAAWCIAAIVSAVMLNRERVINEAGDNKDLFNQAIDLYLKGDYYQVERLLGKLLDKNVRDLDARLLLATLLRHTGRYDEAWKQLDQLACFDGAEKWELEIQSERKLLAEGRENARLKAMSGTAIAPIAMTADNNAQPDILTCKAVKQD